MKKYLVFMIFIVLASCGKPMVKVKNERFNNPNGDFDYDGISNIDEITLGQSPYINTTLVDNFLGENSISLKVRIRTQTDNSEVIKFLSLEQSKNMFDENAFIKPIFNNQYSLAYNLNLTKEKIDKKLYFLNTLGCISKSQLKSLEVKYGNFSVKDADIYSDLSKYEKFKETNFYIYDFKSIQNIYFFESSQNNLLKYQSHQFELNSKVMNNGFCILYEKHKRPEEILSLRPIFRLKNSSISKIFVSDKYLNGSELISSLELGNLSVSDNLYFNKGSVDLNKYSVVQRFTNQSLLDLSDVKIGDYITVHRYISSNIKNRGQEVGRSAAYVNRYRREEPYIEKISNGCIHYQRPKKKSQPSYRSIENLNLDEFDLTVGAVLIAPEIVNGFYIKYSFQVTAEMMKSGLFSLNYSRVSKQKFMFESVLYRKPIKGKCNGKDQVSKYKDFMDFENSFLIEKTGSL